MKKQIAVSGSDGCDANLSEYALKVAEEVGYHIAEHSAVLLCGGRGGIMEASSRGAKSNNGLTIGILPDDKSAANEFIDIAITTGMDMARNYLLINSADAVIGISGRWGTLNEISYSLCTCKPTIIIKGTGGWMDLLSDPEIVKEFEMRPTVTTSAKEAVEMALEMIGR
ncbi:MAG: TIGR00725 family protein [Halobacteriota archaeon]|nr:TIGR00725 family protein [Halobacteriota archaeon]